MPPRRHRNSRGVGRVAPAERAELTPRSAGTLDRDIALLAERQDGPVSIEQLQGLGMTASAIDRRCAAGSLHPVHRGVYVVGYPGLTQRGKWMAAVLAGGPGALLSHRDC